MKNSKKTKKLLAAFSCLAMVANVETTQNNRINAMETQEEKRKDNKQTPITGKETKPQGTNINHSQSEMVNKDESTDESINQELRELEKGAEWLRMTMGELLENGEKEKKGKYKPYALLITNGEGTTTNYVALIYDTPLYLKPELNAQKQSLEELLQATQNPPEIIIYIGETRDFGTTATTFYHRESKQKYVVLTRSTYTILVNPATILTSALDLNKGESLTWPERQKLQQTIPEKLASDKRIGKDYVEEYSWRGMMYEAMSCGANDTMKPSSMHVQAAKTAELTLTALDYFLSQNNTVTEKEKTEINNARIETKPAITNIANQQDKEGETGTKEDEEIQKNIGKLESFGNLLTQRMLEVSKTKAIPTGVLARPHALLIKPKDDNNVESVNTTGLYNLFYPQLRIRKKGETLKEVLDNTPDPEEVIISVGECKSGLVKGSLYTHPQTSKTYVYLKSDKYEILVNPKEILAAGIKSEQPWARNKKTKKHLSQQMSEALHAGHRDETKDTTSPLKEYLYQAMGAGNNDVTLTKKLYTRAVNASAATITALETILSRPCDAPTLTENADGKTTIPRWGTYAIGTAVGIGSIAAVLKGYKIYNNNSPSHSSTKHKNTNSKKGGEVPSSA